MNSSLTLPHDTETEQFIPRDERQGIVLTDEQVKAAVAQNVSDVFIRKFPRVEKYLQDPLYNNQTYCLHSFIPAQGATPDEQGLFGLMKCRGTFHSDTEANDRAEWLIRNVDTYNDIFTGYVGRPFPIGKDIKKYVSETIDIDIRKKTAEISTADVKSKKEDEKRDIKETKNREKKLLEESKEDYEPDPQERYTTLQVKRANLVFTYIKTQKALAELKDKIILARADIVEMREESEDYHKNYFQRYMDARIEAGVKETPEESEENWMKYMVEDAVLDFE